MPNQWSDDLAIGVEEIDAQHRELYATTATLRDAMRSNRLDRVPEVLEFLERYAVEHFATEERYMEATAYPDLPVHRTAHRDFVDGFLQHKSSFASGIRPSLVVDLSDWLGRWLGEHIRKMDGQMGRHLRSRPPR